MKPTAINPNSYCDFLDLPTPPCQNTAARDLLFLVDASDSMSYDRFYSEMLDYTLALYCAFSVRELNQVGMITFNREVVERIPLDVYTRDQWHAEVEALRATKNTINELCCTCCTPMAEAFDLALEVFNLKQKSQFRIAFVITDGFPSNNKAGSPTNPAYWFYGNDGFNPAQYSSEIVAQQAQKLKQGGNRIFLVGVPSVFNQAPNVEFFSGIGSYSKRRIRFKLVRSGKKFFSYYEKGPNPIVSFPLDKNSFSMNSWNVPVLINGTIGALCEQTFFPTRSPSLSPSLSMPSRAPSVQPTLKPTSAIPTLAPTKRPTSQFPTKSPTLLPTMEPTSQSPSVSPTPRVTNSPTPFPQKPDLTQMDLTFVLDRSASMNDYKALCKALNVKSPIIEGFTNNVKSPCWEVISRFVLAQSDLVSEIRAGPSGNRALGWADDFDPFLVPAAGLRVNVIAFACTAFQTEPLVFELSQDLLGGPITSRRQLVEFLNFLLDKIIPAMGTCPGLAIEKSVQYIERTRFEEHPFQSVILVTDGVFYDAADSKIASLGLEAYQASRFAIGIAIDLSDSDAKTQENQLTAFVGGDLASFKNLGKDGWALLQGVSASIAADIKRGALNLEPIPRGWWCGYQTKAECVTNVNCKFALGKCYRPEEYTLSPSVMQTPSPTVPLFFVRIYTSNLVVQNMTALTVCDRTDMVSECYYPTACSQEVKVVGYVFTAPKNGTYRFTTDGLGASCPDTTLFVVQKQVCNDDISSENSRSQVSIPLIAGEEINLLVGSWKDFCTTKFSVGLGVTLLN